MNSGRRAQVDKTYLGAISIKAWNAFVSGEPLSKLYFDIEKSKHPEIVGLKKARKEFNDLIVNYKNKEMK